MLDTILESLKKILKSRLFPVILIYLGLFTILIIRLFYLQIVSGNAVVQEIQANTEVTQSLKSTRGNIRDRNGKLLAGNELAYSVSIRSTSEITDSQEKNAMIFKLIQLIENNGGKINYDFPIKMNKDGSLYFSIEGSTLLRFKKDAYSIMSGQELTLEQTETDPEQMFEYIAYANGSNDPAFEIAETYSKEETLKIMAIRYALFITRGLKYSPVTIALDVNNQIVMAINENRSELPGVEVNSETHRVYKDSQYFAAILGYTGLVTSEDMDNFTDSGDNSGYDLSDQMGKTGLEMKYENELRGTKGSETLIIGTNREVIDKKDKIDPVAGNDIYLTLDSDLQKACYTIIEKKLAGILLSKIVNSTNVGSKGTSADNILIPIYDVYFALIDNNVIDINSFGNEDATNLEKSVHKKYLNKRKSVFKQLDSILAFGSGSDVAGYSDEMKEYVDYIYTFMEKEKILLESKIDQADKTYLDYVNGRTSLSAFLQYALVNDWIDLTKLNIGEKYYNTKELYEKLITYVKSLLEKDVKFNKKLYNFLVYSYKLTGKEICLLLFDQGVLKYNKSNVAALKNGSLSPYDFIISRIKSLEITPGQLALKPCSGSIVITDVKTGQVLACVTYPSYDNNKFANTIDSQYFSKLSNDQSFPMMNRPTRQATAPGSTFKMVAATAILEEGVVTPDEIIQDKVKFDKVSGPPPHCWKSSSHGKVNVLHAIGVSCNYFFYEGGYRLSLNPKGIYDSKLGLDKLTKYASMYGFNEKSGIELYEEQPSISQFDSVRSAIGQGQHAFTPVQISRYVTAIANAGTCFNLTIIDKMKQVDGKVILDNKATVYNQLKLKDMTWDNIHKGMYEVVNGSESTISGLFKRLDVQVAGKTGTAQIVPSVPNHGLFVSYAPFDKPEISVTTVMPNGYTSSNAAEVTRDVYRFYFDKANRKALLAEPVKKPELNKNYTD